MTDELQKCISGRTEEGFLAGEPARGLGASRRPFGDVRFSKPSEEYRSTITYESVYFKSGLDNLPRQPAAQT